MHGQCDTEIFRRCSRSHLGVQLGGRVSGIREPIATHLEVPLWLVIGQHHERVAGTHAKDRKDETTKQFHKGLPIEGDD